MIIEGTKQVTLTKPILDYALVNSTATINPHLEACRAETEALGDRAVMQIDPLQGALLQSLASAAAAGINNPTAVEVGTFTGYSAMCLALGLGPNSTTHCFDVSDEYTAIARKHWHNAALNDRITLTLGDATQTLTPTLDSLNLTPDNTTIDIAFIDADKHNYLTYFETLLPRMRPGALILLDNTLWNGDAANPSPTDNTDENLHAIQHLNTTLTKDPRITTTLLPLSDGLTLARSSTP